MVMSADTASKQPNVAEVISGFLRGVPRDRQPLLIALAERLAAERYRAWAAAADGSRQSELLACAEREEQIARRVEGLYPDGAAQQRALIAEYPVLLTVNDTLFAGRPVAEQFAIQAQGERLGAATWRSFANHAPDAETRATFLACAELEEASARVLESHLGRRAEPD
jgi:hypothetical protein